MTRQTERIGEHNLEDQELGRQAHLSNETFSLEKTVEYKEVWRQQTTNLNNTQCRQTLIIMKDHRSFQWRDFVPLLQEILIPKFASRMRTDMVDSEGEKERERRANRGTRTVNSTATSNLLLLPSWSRCRHLFRLMKPYIRCKLKLLIYKYFMLN